MLTIRVNVERRFVDGTTHLEVKNVPYGSFDGLRYLDNVMCTSVRMTAVSPSGRVLKYERDYRGTREE